MALQELDTYDRKLIEQAESEGMVIRKPESVLRPAEVRMSNGISFDLLAEQRATEEGMPESVFKRK